jgi:radical SAM superfamily enzyme YgiQ (UPF0313 family)
VRKVNPEVTIATDIIAGFPGETEADFDETFALCKQYQFPCLYINQFFPRPGTPAAAMEKVDTQLVKQRTKRLSEYFRSYLPHTGKIGRRYEVLAAEESTDKQWYVAHNKSYDQILVPKRPELLGRTFEVEIIEVGKFHMMGRVIEGTLGPEPVPPSANQWRAAQKMGLVNSSVHLSTPGAFLPLRSAGSALGGQRLASVGKWARKHLVLSAVFVFLLFDLLVVLVSHATALASS